MTQRVAPDGWAFYSADFSEQTLGINVDGVVTLIRCRAQRALWHKMPDAFKEAINCPPLYVYGRGATLDAALAQAGALARIARPIPDLRGQEEKQA